jgi:phosphate acetyltransferase
VVLDRVRADRRHIVLPEGGEDRVLSAADPLLRRQVVDLTLNPNPTAEQLADIAIASAQTASQFGIEPRVAMLSYSTGESGRGPEVEKVRAATTIARARHPDLNTGNNTYRAVQRSAGAVAIGPVLQGLRKPVNDLSRGALVRDIVNTVAITAIQAQK